MAGSSGERVRLRLIPGEGVRPTKPAAIVEIEAERAAFEATTRATPAASLLEDETGLGADALARLRAEGLDHAEARALGRRLRGLGLARSESVYRRLIALARVGGIARVGELDDERIRDALAR